MSNTCTVTISGHAVQIQEGSLKITSRVDDKDKATFTVIDSTGTAAYNKGQPVRITDSQLGLLFSGFINKPTATNLFPSATTMWSCDCVNKFVTISKKATRSTSTTTGSRKHHRGGKHKNQHSGTIAALQIQEYVEPEGVTGNFGLDWAELQSDWQSGTLSGVAATTNTSTGNPGAGDLELAPSGPQLSFVGAGAGFFGGNGLMLTGYASSGYASAYTYQQIWSGSQVINSVGGGNDTFSYDVWIASTSPQIMAGCDFICSDGTTFSSTGQTDNAQTLSCAVNTDLSGLANDQWCTRFFFLPSSLNGKTLTGVFVALGGANQGTYTAYFRRITYGIAAGGSVTIFGDNSTLQMNAQSKNNGYTNISLAPVTTRDKSSVVTHTLNIGAANIIQSTKMSWTQQVPTGCTAIRETSIDGGASWQQITNGGSVPNLLPGMVVTGRTIMYRDTMIRGNDPSSAFSVFGPNPLVINQAYQATKSDSIKTFTTSTDFSGGTLTNLVTAGSNGVTLNQVARNWDNGDYSNQTQYGSIGSTVLNKQFQLSANTSTEGRSRLDFANQWQNFTAEVDFVFSAANVQCGFVWRTTGWQNANDTYAYTATVSSSQVQFGRGTNTSSGAGSFTSIATVSLSLSVNSSHRLKIVVNGNNHQIYVDNVLLINQNDSTYPAAGYIGLRILNAGSGVQTGTFDNFGVVTSLSGTWQSPSINIAGPGTYGGSLIQWDTDGLPDSTTSISVQTSIDGGSTWQNASNGGTVSGLTSGQSLTGKTLLLKATLTASNAPIIPTMNGITAWILGFYSSTGSRNNAPMVWDSVNRLPVASGWGNASNGTTYTQTGTATTAVSANEATITNTSGDCHMAAGPLAYRTTILNDTPLAYYRLDETSGTAVNDSSGNSYTGTISGGVTLGTTGLLAGDSDTAMTFNGTTGFISLPTAFVPTGAHAWSLECWCKATALPATSGYACMVSMGGYTNGQAAQIKIHNNAGTTQFMCATFNGDISGGPTVATGTVYHVVGTYDGTNTRLYVNGSLVAGPTPFTLNLVASYADIGADGGSGTTTEYWNGVIDEPTYYNYALSSTQVSNHYFSGSTSRLVATDEDGSVRFQLSAATISAGIELRYVDNGNFYRLVAAQNSLSIVFVVRGVAFTLATSTPTISTGTWYRMRFQVIGSGPITLNGRVWLDGTTEPINTWNVTATQ